MIEEMNLDYLDNVEPEEDIKVRKNPFCVISKDVFGEYGIRDIQTNTSWSENPYGEAYAVVPDDMVESIIETRGFCDVELNEDGTEVVSFTHNEIPDIPDPIPELTINDRLCEVEAQLIATDEIAVDLYEQQLAQEEINIAQDEAIVAIYEMLEV